MILWNSHSKNLHRHTQLFVVFTLIFLTAYLFSTSTYTNQHSSQQEQVVGEKSLIVSTVNKVSSALSSFTPQHEVEENAHRHDLLCLPKDKFIPYHQSLFLFIAPADDDSSTGIDVAKLVGNDTSVVIMKGDRLKNLFSESTGSQYHGPQCISIDAMDLPAGKYIATFSQVESYYDDHPHKENTSASLLSHSPFPFEVYSDDQHNPKMLPSRILQQTGTTATRKCKNGRCVKTDKASYTFSIGGDPIKVSWTGNTGARGRIVVVTSGGKPSNKNAWVMQKRTCTASPQNANKPQCTGPVVREGSVEFNIPEVSNFPTLYDVYLTTRTYTELSGPVTITLTEDAVPPPVQSPVALPPTNVGILKQCNLNPMVSNNCIHIDKDVFILDSDESIRVRWVKSPNINFKIVLVKEGHNVNNYKWEKKLNSISGSMDIPLTFKGFQQPGKHHIYLVSNNGIAKTEPLLVSIVSETRQPTEQPSNQPSSEPSNQPSSEPSNQPSSEPSNQPSSEPSNQPSESSDQPSNSPISFSQEYNLTNCPHIESTQLNILIDMNTNVISELTQLLCIYDSTHDTCQSRLLGSAGQEKSLSSILKYGGNVLSAIKVLHMIYTFIDKKDEPSLTQIQAQLNDIRNMIGQNFRELYSIINNAAFNDFWNTRMQSLDRLDRAFKDYANPNRAEQHLDKVIDRCFEIDPLGVFIDLYHTSCTECKIQGNRTGSFFLESRAEYRYVEMAFTHYDKSYHTDDAFQFLYNFGRKVLAGMYEAFIFYIICPSSQTEVICNDNYWLDRVESMTKAIVEVYNNYIEMAEKLTTCYKKQVRLSYHNINRFDEIGISIEDHFSIRINGQSYMPRKSGDCSVLLQRCCPKHFGGNAVLSWKRNTCFVSCNKSYKHFVDGCFHHDLNGSPWKSIGQDQHDPKVKSDLVFDFVRHKRGERVHYNIARFKYDEWNDPNRCDRYTITKRGYLEDFKSAGRTISAEVLSIHRT